MLLGEGGQIFGLERFSGENLRMRLWTIFVHHFKREEELTISHWQRFTAHVKVEAEFPRSYKSVFASYFFYCCFKKYKF